MMYEPYLPQAVLTHKPALVYMPVDAVDMAFSRVLPHGDVTVVGKQGLTLCVLGYHEFVVVYLSTKIMVVEVCESIEQWLLLVSLLHHVKKREQRVAELLRRQSALGLDIYPAEEPAQASTGDGQQHSNKRVVIISLIIAVVAVAIGYAFYAHAQSGKESEAYEYAMGSNDPNVLQSYLDTFGNGAPQEHVDSIQSHLDRLHQIDQDWTNAVVTGTKEAIEQYMRQHPDSPFKSVAVHKIDSIDWVTAQTTNTVEALEDYIEGHPSGEHVDDANDLIKGLNAKTVQPEEKVLVASAFNSFFTGINTKDETVVTSVVAQLLTSFLGKQNATRADVVTFMHKLYKGNVASQNWASLDNYKISKKEIGDNQYEYTTEFSAVQNVEMTDGTSTKNNYRINAKVNPDGQITQLLMTRILE